MNVEMEETIIRLFFNKQIRQRVLFELRSPKKRGDAIQRLNHNYEETLKKEHMYEIPRPNSDPRHIFGLLKKYGAGDRCYVISYHTLIDGKDMDLKKALDGSVGLGMPPILYCYPKPLAYFEAEQEYGAPPRFILNV